MIYLASPYTHANPEVVLQRVETVRKVTARMIEHGKIVFSPIVYSHTLVPAMARKGMTSFSDWEAFDLRMLSLASNMIVLTLTDWENSVGVKAEIAYATAFGIQVDYFSVADILQTYQEAV